MTNPIIPYKFIPGTKANAEEINSNFTSLAEKIQNIESYSSDRFDEISNDLKSEIDGLYNSYSDINLSNNGLITNSILEAPNGIAEYENSTITIKSGLKLLIPNGKDEKEKLKNITHTVETDFSFSISNLENGERILFIDNSNECILTLSKYYFIQNDEPLSPDSSNYVWYNPSTNILKQYNIGNQKWDVITATKIGTVTIESELITKLTTNNPTALLKRNDNNEISGWSLPSENSIDLTLGATGTEYTAPANGWVTFTRALGDREHITMSSNDVAAVFVSYGSQIPTISIPVIKGAKFKVTYLGTGTTHKFKFIYAQGESEE